LVYGVPDYQQALYRRVFVNLPFINGDDRWDLPIPATYILDRDRVVLYASASADYTDRPEPSEILEQLAVHNNGRIQNVP
jgi:peroxiredoxin